MPTIQIKYSTTSGHAPNSLLPGQLAINLADSALFWADSGGVIQSFNFLAPEGPTLASGDNSDYMATTSFVQGVLGQIKGQPPSVLNTLEKIAAAINDDANFYKTISSSIVNMVRFDQAQGLNGTQQAQVQANIGLQSATIDGGTF